MAIVDGAQANETAKPAATVSASTTPVPTSGALAALQHYLPPNVLSQVNAYFTNPNLTPADANTYALQFIRTTPWYQQTYPGVTQGIQTGLLDANNPETSYLSYKDQLNQLYKQYYGQAATGAQVAHSLTQGHTISRVSAGLQGQAYIGANAPDIQNALGSFGAAPATTAQLTALGNEQAGIDSPLGQQLQLAYQKAQARMNGAFKGVLASPALSLASGRLAGQQAQQPSDVSA